MRAVARVVLASTVVAAMSGCTTTEPLPAVDTRTPPDWFANRGPAGQYTIGTHRIETKSGHGAAFITGGQDLGMNIANISQMLRADSYRGKRVRLSGWIKGVVSQEHLAGLWMRVDGFGVTYGFDNMYGRGVTGSTPWFEASVVLDVPHDAVGISIGAIKYGTGTLFVDDLQFEVVEDDVPTTNQYDAPQTGMDSALVASMYNGKPDTPTNMDFEVLQKGH